LDLLVVKNNVIYSDSFIVNNNVKCSDSLVIKNNVRQPDNFGRHVQLCNSAVLVGVPLELVIPPLLGGETNANWICTNGSKAFCY